MPFSFSICLTASMISLVMARAPVDHVSAHDLVVGNLDPPGGAHERNRLVAGLDDLAPEPLAAADLDALSGRRRASLRRWRSARGSAPGARSPGSRRRPCSGRGSRGARSSPARRQRGRRRPECPRTRRSGRARAARPRGRRPRAGAPRASPRSRRYSVLSCSCIRVIDLLRVLLAPSRKAGAARPLQSWMREVAASG